MSVKNYKQQKNFIGIVLVSFLSLALVVAALINFNNKMRETVESQLGIHLKEIAIQVAEAIDVAMENNAREVERLSFTLSTIKDPLDDSIIPILKDAATYSNVSRFAVVTKDGRVINSSDINAQASDYRYGKAVFSGAQGVSDVFTSKATGQEVISIYAPIYRNGEIVAGVFGTIVIQELNDIVSFSGFNGEGYSRLIQSDGKAIMSTKHRNQIYDLVNFLDFIDQSGSNSSMSTQDIKKSINARESGFIEYTVNDKMRKLYYHPISFKDWYVLSVVPQDVLNNYNNQLYQYAIRLTIRIFMVFVFVLAVFLVWSHISRKRLEQARDYALRSNRKYELAIANTNQQIFEYNVEQGTLLSASDSLCATLQIAKSELPLKQPFNKTFGAEAIEHLGAAFGRALDSGEACFEDQTLHSKWLKLVLCAVRQDKDTIIIGTVEDVTSLKEIQKQYAQEEQYFQVLLGESLLGFSADLENGELLSVFRQGVKAERLEQRFKFLTTATIQRLSDKVHYEHRTLIAKLYNLPNLRNIHQHGIRDLTEYFLIKNPYGEDYIWAAAKIHFLNSPQNGHALIFSYIKNVDEEMRRQLELEYRSEIDELTGVYNRATLIRKIDAALSEQQEAGHTFAFLMTDLDGFKNVNDIYGHQAGDRILRSFANILKEHIGENSYIGRLGGDEFVVFKYGVNNIEEVLQEAKQVCERVEKLSQETYSRSILTVSIGVSSVQDGDNFESIYPRTDRILYQAKASGKNCVWTDETISKNKQ